MIKKANLSTLDFYLYNSEYLDKDFIYYIKKDSNENEYLITCLPTSETTVTILTIEKNVYSNWIQLFKGKIYVIQELLNVLDYIYRN